MKLTKHKIIVTGGLGFIGSHTVVELCNLGFEVVIVDDLSNSSIGVLRGLKNITKYDLVFEKKRFLLEVFLKYFLYFRDLLSSGSSGTSPRL